MPSETQDIKAIPYGYALDSDSVTLLPVQQEQEVLSLVKALISEGLTLAKIAIELDRRMLLTYYFLSIGQNKESDLAVPEPMEEPQK